MSAGAIGNAVSGATSTSNSGAFGQISSTDFMSLLINELSHQDPFKPQDTGALLEQLGTIRNIESQVSLQEQLENLVLQNQVASASGMIGKMVSGLTEDNQAVEGLVMSVRVEQGKAYLELDSGHRLAMTRVSQITDVPVTSVDTSSASGE